jgi:polysaccharide pyruvyl transferase WcaK-like protein
MKIVVFGVRYSPNLGDGVISDCLLHVLQKHFQARVKDVSVVSADLAGRKTFDNEKVEVRAKLLPTLVKLPGFLRKPIIFSYLWLQYHTKLKPYYQKILKDADHIFIGGGQLLSDTDLNFPLKIFWVSRLARRLGVRVSFIACGASQNWSLLGRYLFRASMVNENVVSISCRDAHSIEAVKSYLPEQTIHWQLDPAIFSAEVYQLCDKKAKGTMVGIGFAGFSNLAYSGDGVMYQQEYWFETVHEVIRVLNQRKTKVFLFTNGAAEDEQCLGEFEAYCHGTGLEYERRPRPASPEALVKTISLADCIVAHRLHANIISFALNIPSIGFGWDKKVTSFFAQIDCADNCFEADYNAHLLLAKVDKALSDSGEARLAKLETLKNDFLHTLTASLHL